MSKRVLKKSKRRSKAVLPALGIAGLSFSVPSAATASTGDAMDIPSASQPHQLFLGEEEIFDTSLSTFYTFDKENGEQTSLAQGLKWRAAAVVAAVAAMGAAVDVAAAAAAALYMRAAVAALVPVSAALVPVSAALVPVLSVALADARFLDAASAAVAVAAEAAAVGAAELAGYGHPPGVGSTPAGPNLHRLVKKLASRRSRSLKQGWPRERSNESHCQSSST